jgi:hypothetical protein
LQNWPRVCKSRAIGSTVPSATERSESFATLAPSASCCRIRGTPLQVSKHSDRACKNISISHNAQSNGCVNMTNRTGRRRRRLGTTDKSILSPVHALPSRRRMRKSKTICKTTALDFKFIQLRVYVFPRSRGSAPYCIIAWNALIPRQSATRSSACLNSAHHGFSPIGVQADRHTFASLLEGCGRRCFMPPTPQAAGQQRLPCDD